MVKKKKTNKRKPVQAFAFIDTNIFLDFYRAKNDITLSLLKKLDRVKDKIICTYQVEMEFRKNRQKVIQEIASNSEFKINAPLPAILGDSHLNAAIKKIKTDVKRREKELNKNVLNIIKNPAKYDPIFKTLENIFTSQSEHVLTRDMDIRNKIKRLAWRRFILGYPPRKKNDTAIGDALNWEWIIHCAKQLKGKFIIVSRDTDFGGSYSGECILNDALKSEFIQRVGRKPITLTNKLSEALKLLEVPVSKTEEESENQQLAAESIGFVLKEQLDSINPSANLKSFVESLNQTANLKSFAESLSQAANLKSKFKP